MTINEYRTSNSKYNWQVHHYDDHIDYMKGYELQKEFWKDVVNGGDHHLMLLEHQPVVTMGRRTEKDHLLLTEDEFNERGIDLVDINRGGSATYHGPGQLVGYVICKSSRFGGIHQLVENILNAISISINNMDIPVSIDEENPGIWTMTETPKKLAAVGMQNKKSVTLHGFAVNVDMPLSGFSTIVPCGLTLPVSTLAIEKGERLEVNEYKSKLLPHLLESLDSK